MTECRVRDLMGANNEIQVLKVKIPEDMNEHTIPRLVYPLTSSYSQANRNNGYTMAPGSDIEERDSVLSNPSRFPRVDEATRTQERFHLRDKFLRDQRTKRVCQTAQQQNIDVATLDKQEMQQVDKYMVQVQVRDETVALPMQEIQDMDTVRKSAPRDYRIERRKQQQEAYKARRDAKDAEQRKIIEQLVKVKNEQNQQNPSWFQFKQM